MSLANAELSSIFFLLWFGFESKWFTSAVAAVTHARASTNSSVIEAELHVNLHVCCHRCHQICVLSPASSTAQQHVIWLENDQMSICQRQCLNNNNNMILTTTVRFSFRFVLLSPRNHCNYNCCRCCYFHALVIQIQWKSNERKERASQS